MPILPKVYAAVVGILDPDDAESIATAAAQASMELLLQVSSQAERGKVALDRIAIVQPTPASGRRPADDIADLFRNGPGATPRYAVMVTCRSIEADPKPEAARCT